LEELGRINAERVAGVHVTQLLSLPSGDPAELADLTAEEQGQLATPSGRPRVLRDPPLIPRSHEGG